MSKFFIALNNGSREQQNAITVLLQAKGWDLWHHMEDFWLLANVPDDVTTKNLYEEIVKNPIIEKETLVVMKTSNATTFKYWGRASKDGWGWMDKFFGSAG